MMKKIKNLIIVSFLGIIIPSIVFAAQTYEGFIGTFQDIFSKAVPIIIVLGVITFFIGLIRFIRSADQPQVREEGKQLITYGLIAIFVMVSVWGLVNMVVYTIFDQTNDVMLKASDVPKGPF